MKFNFKIYLLVASIIYISKQLNPANTVIELFGGVAISDQYYTNISIGSEKQLPNLIVDLKKSNI